MTRRTSGFGWLPQRPDHRDRIYNLEERILTPPALPPAHDLWPKVPEIWDQGQLGSCVAHGSLRAFLTEAQGQGLSLPMLSRLWVYAKGRDLEGTPLTTDQGMQVRDGVKVLATLGAPPESDWAYTDAKPGPVDQEPPATLDDRRLAPESDPIPGRHRGRRRRADAHGDRLGSCHRVRLLGPPDVRGRLLEPSDPGPHPPGPQRRLHRRPLRGGHRL